MKDFFTININGEDYVHIDTILYKNQKIYHFGALKDDVFCTKCNCNYIQIKDNFQISLLKNILGIINRSYFFSIKDKFEKYKNCIRYLMVYKEYDLDEKDIIVNEQIENFKYAKKKLNLSIDINKVTGKVKNINLVKFHASKVARGYYIPGLNVIGLDEEVVDAKKTRFHEYIHGITGRKCVKYDLFNATGILEGETENLAQDVLVNDDTSFFRLSSDNINFCFNFNCSNSGKYADTVLIVKQMEYLLGKKSYNSVLKGNLEFERDFSKKYGKLLTIFLLHRTKILISNSKLLERNEGRYLKDTQDILMKKVFDLEFKDIKDIDDAKQYFQKLRGFETVRARVYIGEKEDTAFRDYYNEKYKNCVYILKNKGINENEINSNLESYRYQRQEFKSLLSKDKEEEVYKGKVINYMADILMNNNKLNRNDFSYKYYKISKNSYVGFIIRRGTQKGFIIPPVEKNLDDKEMVTTFYNKFTNIDDIEDSLEEQDIGEYLDYLESSEFNEEEIEFSDFEFSRALYHTMVNSVNFNRNNILKAIGQENVKKVLEYDEEELKKCIDRSKSYYERKERENSFDSEEILPIKIKRLRELIRLSKIKDDVIHNFENRLEDVKKEGREIFE